LRHDRHCITQCFVYKTTAVVLKTVNGNLGNKTGFTLYSYLTFFVKHKYTRASTEKVSKGDGGNGKNKTEK